MDRAPTRLMSKVGNRALPFISQPRRRSDSTMSQRNVYHGEHTFHPAGAPDVRVRFAVVEGRATAVHVDDGPVQVKAQRVSD